MRIGPGVVMYHEWRDWSVNPYLVGPSMWIRDGKLLVGEKVVLPLPVDQWFHLEVAAKVGTNADAKWKLTVTLPGGQPEGFDFAAGSPKFGNLTWVGWSSSAEAKTVFYLDNIKLTNVK